jgi:hypothetical protein
MSMQWFRLYHRIVDDEKLRLLAFEDRWHFVALCCLKGDGLLDEPDDSLRQRKIAVKLGVQVRELEEIGRRLQEVGLIDESLSPVAWDELQYRSDNSSERVKKYREKQKRNASKRVSNVSVTVQDTDTDTDIEPKGSCETGVSPVRPSEIIEAWNITAADLGLPRIVKLTADRKRKLAARCKDSTLEEFQQALESIRRSKFLQGGNKDGWKANFDFFLQPKSFAKLIEGAYD